MEKGIKFKDVLIEFKNTADSVRVLVAVVSVFFWSKLDSSVRKYSWAWVVTLLVLTPLLSVLWTSALRSKQSSLSEENYDLREKVDSLEKHIKSFRM